MAKKNRVSLTVTVTPETRARIKNLCSNMNGLSEGRLIDAAIAQIHPGQILPAESIKLSVSKGDETLFEKTIES